MLIFLVMTTSCVSAADTIAIVAHDGRLEVQAGSEPFCVVDYRSYDKPIVYPIFGPGQIPMTRNYPMRDGVEGEATDHPHHKSMWFGHGDINGISFWHEEGKIVCEEAKVLAPVFPGGTPAIQLENRLDAPDGELVASETFTLQFGMSPTTRWIDWQVVTHAVAGKLVFGDTKEGTAALRVHPNLRLSNDPKRGVTTAGGQAVNSEGDSGGDVWGKAARWVDYSGTIMDKKVGIAFLDHPANHGHPTHWHARTYGLFAANPFGLSYFEGQEHDGSLTLDEGKSLTFRYRLVFHQGDAQEANVEQLYRDYAEQSK